MSQGSVYPRTSVPEEPDAEMAGRLDAVLERSVAEGSLVGAVTLVARSGSLVYRRAFGQADREDGRRMSTLTTFRLASLTKPFMTTAALSLVERGLMTLDDPVSRWLPNFRPPAGRWLGAGRHRASPADPHLRSRLRFPTGGDGAVPTRGGFGRDRPPRRRHRRKFAAAVLDPSSFCAGKWLAVLVGHRRPGACS